MNHDGIEVELGRGLHGIVGRPLVTANDYGTAESNVARFVIDTYDSPTAGSEHWNTTPVPSRASTSLESCIHALVGSEVGRIVSIGARLTAVLPGVLQR